MKNLDIIQNTLEITSFSDRNYKKATNFKYTYDFETQFFIAEFDSEQSFKKGETYQFKVEYKGFIEADNIGFYRSSYKDISTQKQVKNYNLKMFIYFFIII